jgi:hypothetical protein
MSDNSKTTNFLNTRWEQSGLTDSTAIRFIVPMPGKSSWRTPNNDLTFKKVHSFTEVSGDIALDDFRAHFLMQREYLID